MTWAIENIEMILELTVRHVWLSAVPIVIGFVLALPIGWFAFRHPRLRGTVLGTGSVLYTIPSLPLFVIMPGIIGTGFLSPLNVVIALSIYAVAIMVRSAADAFAAVPAAVVDAARAAGYSKRQLVLRVQLPLAGPVLLAGLRVVSVSTVSLVSVGSLIGVTSLGTLFTDGFNRGFMTEIATVLVALIFDLLLVLAGRALLPWTRARAAR
jgi:osmoprotectant transport system permease protein